MSYRPYQKTTAQGGLTDLPLDAETVKGVDVVNDKLDVEIILFGAGGTLTDAQYSKLSNKNVVIRTSPYQMQGDPQVLYKVEENDTKIEFQGKVYSNYDSTSKITSLMRSIITITKSTKDWQKTSNSYVAIYDYSQTDTLLLNKLSTNQVATVESSTTASKAYAIGDLLIYNETLYKVTSSISSGGTITIGTNVSATTVESLIANKQATLVSGTNIKTVNNTSLLGSGNVSVQPTITGGATTITANNLTASKALVSNSSGKVAVSSVSSTELGYLSGVTSAIQTQINNKTTLNEVYPVGAIYMSVNSTSPASLFGGTWEQLKDKFLLGAGNTYSNGSTGGEATHTLSENEMPNHNHKARTVKSNGSGPGSTISTNDSWSFYVESSETSFTGGNQPHNNMPPYLVVYMWKRTA